MSNYSSLSHTTWDCKYHVVFIPKYRRKALYYTLRKMLPEVLIDLALQQESKVEEGHMMPDHIHLLLSIPPKHSVSKVVGYLKGKSAIWIARKVNGSKRNFYGQSFWARGYFVSTAGKDESVVREYIRRQEEEDRKFDSSPQLPGLFKN